MLEASPLTQKLIKDTSRLKGNSLGDSFASGKREEHLLKKIFFTNSRKINTFNESATLRRFFIKKYLEDPAFTDDHSHFILKIKSSPEIFAKNLSPEDEEKIISLIKEFKQLNSNKNADNFSFTIDRIISSPNEKETFLFYAFNSLKKIIKIEEDKITESEKNIILYLSVQQTIFGFDKDLAIYNTSIVSDESFQKIKELSETLLLKKVSLICFNYKTPLLIIRNILREDGKNHKDIFSNPEETEKKIISVYKKIEEDRLNRSYRYIAASTIIIALLSFLVSFSLTIPLLKISLTLIPIIFCALLVTEIKPIPQKNTKKIVLESLRLIYKKEEAPHYFVKPPKKINKIYFFINLLYALLFSVFFGLAFWSLSFLNISTLSIISLIFLFVFIFFTKINAKRFLKDLSLINRKDSFFDSLTEIIAFPLLKIRQIFITKKYSPYLLLASSGTKSLIPFLRDLLREKTIILKEKKEKLYEE